MKITEKTSTCYDATIGATMIAESMDNDSKVCFEKEEVREQENTGGKEEAQEHKIEDAKEVLEISTATPSTIEEAILGSSSAENAEATSVKEQTTTIAAECEEISPDKSENIMEPLLNRNIQESCSSVTSQETEDPNTGIKITEKTGTCYDVTIATTTIAESIDGEPKVCVEKEEVQEQENTSGKEVAQEHKIEDAKEVLEIPTATLTTIEEAILGLSSAEKVEATSVQEQTTTIAAECEEISQNKSKNIMEPLLNRNIQDSHSSVTSQETEDLEIGMKITEKTSTCYDATIGATMLAESMDNDSKVCFEKEEVQEQENTGGQEEAQEHKIEDAKEVHEMSTAAPTIIKEAILGSSSAENAEATSVQEQTTTIAVECEEISPDKSENIMEPLLNRNIQESCSSVTSQETEDPNTGIKITEKTGTCYDVTIVATTIAESTYNKSKVCVEKEVVREQENTGGKEKAQEHKIEHAKEVHEISTATPTIIEEAILGSSSAENAEATSVQEQTTTIAAECEEMSANKSENIMEPRLKRNIQESHSNVTSQETEDPNSSMKITEKTATCYDATIAATTIAESIGNDSKVCFEKEEVREKENAGAKEEAQEDKIEDAKEVHEISTATPTSIEEAILGSSSAENAEATSVQEQTTVIAAECVEMSPNKSENIMKPLLNRNIQDSHSSVTSQKTEDPNTGMKITEKIGTCYDVTISATMIAESIDNDSKLCFEKEEVREQENTGGKVEAQEHKIEDAKEVHEISTATPTIIKEAILGSSSAENAEATIVQEQTTVIAAKCEEISPKKSENIMEPLLNRNIQDSHSSVTSQKTEDSDIGMTITEKAGTCYDATMGATMSAESIDNNSKVCFEKEEVQEQENDGGKEEAKDHKIENAKEVHEISTATPTIIKEAILGSSSAESGEATSVQEQTTAIAAECEEISPNKSENIMEPLLNRNIQDSHSSVTSQKTKDPDIGMTITEKASTCYDATIAATTIAESIDKESKVCFEKEEVREQENAGGKVEAQEHKIEDAKEVHEISTATLTIIEEAILGSSSAENAEATSVQEQTTVIAAKCEEISQIKSENITEPLLETNIQESHSNVSSQKTEDLYTGMKITEKTSTCYDVTVGATMTAETIESNSKVCFQKEESRQHEVSNMEVPLVTENTTDNGDEGEGRIAIEFPKVEPQLIEETEISIELDGLNEATHSDEQIKGRSLESTEETAMQIQSHEEKVPELSTITAKDAAEYIKEEIHDKTDAKVEESHTRTKEFNQDNSDENEDEISTVDEALESEALKEATTAKYYDSPSSIDENAELSTTISERLSLEKQCATAENHDNACDEISFEEVDAELGKHNEIDDTKENWMEEAGAAKDIQEALPANPLVSEGRHFSSVSSEFSETTEEICIRKGEPGACTESECETKANSSRMVAPYGHQNEVNINDEAQPGNQEQEVRETPCADPTAISPENKDQATQREEVLECLSGNSKATWHGASEFQPHDDLMEAGSEDAETKFLNVDSEAVGFKPKKENEMVTARNNTTGDTKCDDAIDEEVDAGHEKPDGNEKIEEHDPESSNKKETRVTLSINSTIHEEQDIDPRSSHCCEVPKDLSIEKEQNAVRISKHGIEESGDTSETSRENRKAVNITNEVSKPEAQEEIASASVHYDSPTIAEEKVESTIEIGKEANISTGKGMTAYEEISESETHETLAGSLSKVIDMEKLKYESDSVSLEVEKQCAKSTEGKDNVCTEVSSEEVDAGQGEPDEIGDSSEKQKDKAGDIKEVQETHTSSLISEERDIGSTSTEYGKVTADVCIDREEQNEQKLPEILKEANQGNYFTAKESEEQANIQNEAPEAEPQDASATNHVESTDVCQKNMEVSKETEKASITIVEISETVGEVKSEIPSHGSLHEAAPKDSKKDCMNPELETSHSDLGNQRMKTIDGTDGTCDETFNGGMHVAYEKVDETENVEEHVTEEGKAKDVHVILPTKITINKERNNIAEHNETTGETCIEGEPSASECETEDNSNKRNALDEDQIEGKVEEAPKAQFQEQEASKMKHADFPNISEKEAEPSTHIESVSDLASEKSKTRSEVTSEDQSHDILTGRPEDAEIKDLNVESKLVDIEHEKQHEMEIVKGDSSVGEADKKVHAAFEKAGEIEIKKGIDAAAAHIDVTTIRKEREIGSGSTEQSEVTEEKCIEESSASTVSKCKSEESGEKTATMTEDQDENQIGDQGIKEEPQQQELSETKGAVSSLISQENVQPSTRLDRESDHMLQKSAPECQPHESLKGTFLEDAEAKSPNVESEPVDIVPAVIAAEEKDKKQDETAEGKATESENRKEHIIENSSDEVVANNSPEVLGNNSVLSQERDICSVSAELTEKKCVKDKHLFDQQQPNLETEANGNNKETINVTSEAPPIKDLHLDVQSQALATTVISEEEEIEASSLYQNIEDGNRVENAIQEMKSLEAPAKQMEEDEDTQDIPIKANKKEGSIPSDVRKLEHQEKESDTKSASPSSLEQETESNTLTKKASIPILGIITRACETSGDEVSNRQMFGKQEIFEPNPIHEEATEERYCGDKLEEEISNNSLPNEEEPDIRNKQSKTPVGSIKVEAPILKEEVSSIENFQKEASLGHEEENRIIPDRELQMKNSVVVPSEMAVSTDSENASSILMDKFSETMEKYEGSKNLADVNSAVELVKQGREVGKQNLSENTKGNPMSADTSATSLSDLLQKSTQDTWQMVKDLAENKQPKEAKLQVQNWETEVIEHEEMKTDEESNELAEDENRETETRQDVPGLVENSKDVDIKVPHKKSHNILSGVGSKVKQSISKVKKVITGKSSHSKAAHSPK